jgi:peptidoglycan/xylan/chitin deacetylase (PgdA/CDA1 family)
MHGVTDYKSAAALAAVAGVAAGAWFYAALCPTSQVFGRVVIAGEDPAELALTYDDGPNPAATPQLLEVLARHNVRATFFLIGRHVRLEPALAREIVAAGHTVGNHTMTHPWLAWQSGRRIRAEIADTNALLEDTLGQPVRLFRPPHGARRPVVLRTAAELGLSTVNWNIITHDWRPQPSARIVELVRRGIARNENVGRGSNVLMHDGGEASLGQPRMNSVYATETVILDACAAKRRFVTPEDWI